MLSSVRRELLKTGNLLLGEGKRFLGLKNTIAKSYVDGNECGLMLYHYSEGHTFVVRHVIDDDIPSNEMISTCCLMFDSLSQSVLSLHLRPSEESK